jgi:hypothetical protein
MDEERLLQKLRDLEALAAGGATDGERAAAGHARERVLARLRDVERTDPPVEYRFTLRDGWSKRLFLALLRRYGLRPYRYRGQRHTTVMVRVSRRFVEQTLWPHFERINAELSDHLEQVAERVIAAAMEAPVTDEDVREDAQRQLDLPEEEHG